jgi:myosin heavy subunit
MDDLFEYNETLTAMRVIGLSEDDIKSVCSVTAAILHLGNVQFKGEKADLVDNDGITKAAALLGVDVGVLGKAFMKPLVRISTNFSNHLSLSPALIQLKLTFLQHKRHSIVTL